MGNEELAVLEELDRENRHRTRREWGLVAAIIVFGVILALVIGYLVTDTDEGVRSIKCEQGDVVLILERADGTAERVQCPAGASVKP